MLSIIAFIYNNSIYLSTNKVFYKLLIDYIVDCANAFVSRLLTKEILLAIEQAK